MPQTWTFVNSKLKLCIVRGLRGAQLDSDSFTSCCLSLQKEGFWEFAFATNLEGAEVFVPEALGSLGVGFAPKFQFVQVLGGNFALCEAIEKVLAEAERKIRPLNLRHGS